MTRKRKMEVEEIKVVKVDDVNYQVENLSDNAKTLVSLLNDWRNQEADAQSSLALVRAAIRDLTNELISVIRADVEASPKPETA
jgi:hypothetical protein